MKPATYNLAVYQGDSFSLELVLTDDAATPAPIDISGWTGKAEVRTKAGPGGQLLASFDVTVVDGPGGRVRIKLPSSESAKIIADGVWDLRFTDAAGDRKTWLRGTVKVIHGVTA